MFVILASQPALAQDAYTYGDLLTGEEVRVTKETLKQQIVDRLFVSERMTSYAAALQISGDGISCDMMITWLLLQQTPDLGLIVAAQQAQMICIQAGR